VPAFVICQFELNLLNQAVYTHASASYLKWRAFTAPFANTLLCFSGHGLGTHNRNSILRFVQQQEGHGLTRVQLSWELIEAYSVFFFGEYLEQFARRATEFDRGAFLRSVADDPDCIATVYSSSGDEVRHARDLIKK
jgi:hypothetical protein